MTGRCVIRRASGDGTYVTVYDGPCRVQDLSETGTGEDGDTLTLAQTRVLQLPTSATGPAVSDEAELTAGALTGAVLRVLAVQDKTDQSMRRLVVTERTDDDVYLRTDDDRTWRH